MDKQVPHQSMVYRALDLVEPSRARVVIVGSDPYPDPNLATGVAFEVTNGTPLPPTLKNIYKELEEDIGVKRTQGSLMDWVEQDVLLLNTALTVEEGKPGSHIKEWQEFTEDLITLLIDSREYLVFMLWGRQARSLAKLFPKEHTHLVLEAAHPSPLGAYRGFFGCKHFSKCNQFLRDNGLKVITW